MHSVKTYTIKRGLADMFRGDWYDQEEAMETRDEAIAKAATQTLEEYFGMPNDWEQYGYEWSVFEKENGVEKKIWSGWKYIYHKRPKKGEVLDINLGNV
jgi:hypothetical protein